MFTPHQFRQKSLYKKLNKSEAASPFGFSKIINLSMELVRGQVQRISIVVFSLAIIAIPLVNKAEISAIQEGDLVRTADSPALYLIESGQKRVFPHVSVYLSWGLPEDFGTVQVVSDLSTYPEGEAISFRDGSLFRGTTTSLYEKESSCVFFVSNGQLRPIKSGEIYQGLFNDPDWEKVKWIPDDLLDKFTYPIGQIIDSSGTHPDGSLVRYQGSQGIYLVESGKKRPITSLETFDDNRLNLEDVIEIEPTEIYADSSEVKPREEKLTLNIPNVYKTITFIKHYRVKDLSAANGIRQTKDGGYIFTGQTIVDRPYNSPPMTDEDAFISKIDANGSHQWTKLFQSFHSVKIEKSIPGTLKRGEEVGRDIIELKDGSYLAASQGTGFVDNEYLKYTEDWDDIFTEGNWDDIFITKFDEKGNYVWTRMIGDYAGDYVYKLYATEDNGFLLSAEFTKTGFGGAPKAPTYFILAKFSQNGEKEWVKKADMDDFDIKPLANGGFIALGNIKVTGRESSPEEKFDGSTMPVIIKFNRNFGIEWAKSFEAIPLEEPIYKITEEGHTYLDYYRTTRSAAGNFLAVYETSGGYLALGFLFPLTTGGSWSIPSRDFPLVAVKINNSGVLQWARTIKLGMSLEDDIKKTKIIKTKDNGFVLKMDYIPPLRSDQGSKSEIVQEKLKQFNDLCKSKNREMDCQAGEIDDDSELLQAWEDYAETAKSFRYNYNNCLLLLKTDADFNPGWSKTIAMENDLSYGNNSIYGYDMQSTKDYGLIIAGRYDTPILNYITGAGGPMEIRHFFQDTLLIKLDANGQAANSEGIIFNYTDLSLEDVSSYITLKDFPPEVESLDFKIDKPVQPKTPSYETKVLDLCSPVVKLVKPTGSVFLPKISPSEISAKTKTWAEINYDKAENIDIPIGKIFQSYREIHQEVLPILNELFHSEVKLKDDFGGLEYIFKRLPTENDKIAIQEYLEGLGYKTYAAEGEQLMVGKIGRTLTLSFSFVSKIKGTMFVSW